MNQLIRIEETKEGKKSVSARDLYKALELSGGQFSRWAKKNIIDNPFAIEHEDFEGFDMMSSGNEIKDYALSIEFSKKLSMIARTKRGEQVRDYFIECEDKLKEVFKIPQTYSQALLLASRQAEKIESQDKLLLEQQPKVDFYDRIVETDKKISIQEVAGVLNFKKMGRNNLFKFLRSEGILSDRNIPYRQYIESGYFELKEKTKETKNGDMVFIVTLATQKGLDFIRKKLIERLED